MQRFSSKEYIQCNLFSFKGQISLEFLFIFLIFISSLSLFVFHFSNNKTKTDEHFQEILMRKYGSDIVSTINVLCILGQGNVRNLYIHFLNPVNISTKDYSLLISSNNKTFEYKVDCKLNNTDIITKGPNLIIDYSGDRIQLRRTY